MNEVSILSKKNIHTPLTPGYADAVKNNMNQEDSRKNAKNKDKFIPRKETKALRRNKEYDLVKRTSIDRYQNLFFGDFYSCTNFGHRATNCRAQLNWNHKRSDRTNKPRLNTRNNQNPFSILTKHDVECYKFRNIGHLAIDFQLKLEKQEEEGAEICGIALCAKKEEVNNT